MPMSLIGSTLIVRLEFIFQWKPSDRSGAIRRLFDYHFLSDAYARIYVLCVVYSTMLN